VQDAYRTEETRMSSNTLTTQAPPKSLGSIRVSELPVDLSPATPGLMVRLSERLRLRRDARAFARALQQAGPSECVDLYAARRRA
jgi:hypothetical protein